MNKKLFIIPIAIGLIVWILVTILTPENTGNHFKMIVPTKAERTKSQSIKKVTIYLDNSGSMKGYVDFAGIAGSKEARASIIGTLSNFMDNIHATYNIDATCTCGGTSYDRKGFLKGMENFSIFKGKITELHKMIQNASETISKSTISVIATDLVLSYGKTKLIAEKDSFYNFHQLSALGAQIHNAMEKCKSKGIEIAVLQYYSDFNGNYYYNYTENLKPNAYIGKLMKNRPYYLVVLGTKENIKGIMANNCFDEMQHVFCSFDFDPKETKEEIFKVSMADSSNVSWLIGDPNNPTNTGSISTNNNFGNVKSELYFTCKRIYIPQYICLNEEHKLTPDWDKSVIENVEEISCDDTNEQKFKITMLPHDKLATTENVWVKLNSNTSWFDTSSTNDDTKGVIDKKTWGLSTVLQNMNKAYRGSTTPSAQTIATFTFNIRID